MNKTRLQIAKKDIIEAMESSEFSVFKKSDIEKILSSNFGFWRLSQETTTLRFINFLLENSQLKRVKFSFPNRNELRYTWGKQSIYSTALTLRPESYLTHYTAMYLNNLTEQIPKTVYVNYEQSFKEIGKSELIQGRIDSAFKNKVRKSNMIAEVDDYRVCLLNGKFTDRLGVADYTTSHGEILKITSIERTLIDITVRPVYSGGVSQVLGAFKSAHDRVSINKLNAMLQKIGFIYPYHQAIGFYLEKSGVYSKSQINLLRDNDFKYDFYLVHKMKDTNYSKEWRLYYPKGF